MCAAVIVLGVGFGAPVQAEELESETAPVTATAADELEEATGLTAKAKELHEQGRHYAAINLAQRALVLREKMLGPNHPDVAAVCSVMASSFAAQGRLTEALSAARRATDIQDRHASASLLSGSEEQKRRYMNTLEAQTHQNISLHLQYAWTNADAARLALTAILRRKGRVLEVMIDSLAALRQSVDPSDHTLVDNLGFIYSQLATQLASGPGMTRPDQYRESLVELEDERQRLEAEIGQRNASFLLENRILTLADVQPVIPIDAVLLEIARYEPIRFPSLDNPKPQLKPRYAAYVLRSNGDPTFVDLGDAKRLESAITTLRRALSDPDLTHDPKPAARALDRLLMQPIRKLLGNTRWVFVSADGPLHLVPFAALVDEKNHYLVEDYVFSYINTGRDLLRFTDRPSRAHEAPLVLANPAFDDSSAPSTPEAAPETADHGLRSIDMVTRRLLPLGGTTKEANTIRELFPDSQVLLGAEATEKAIKSAHGPRFLHLATHGFFLPEQPVPDVLLHRQGLEPTPAEREAILQRENPLLRSGVALAGFNRRQSGTDDGVLTALEAASLDLHGTRLVVLSACETGVGQPISGEGVYGLRRALAMAGAETQVMSLWQVDTGRTRELMEAYYKQLKENGGRSEAMRDVQLAMLSNKETSHPNLWASFIVSGDWRPLEGRSWPPGKRPSVTFPISFGAGGGIPFGNIDTGGYRSEFISHEVPLVLDFGMKVNRWLYLGLYVGVGFGAAGSTLQDRCNETGVSCSSSSLRFGLNFQRYFLPSARINPYVGYGIGYTQAILSTNGIKGLPPGSLRGFEIARLTLGADYRVNSVIGFGPYVDFGLGIYLTRGNELDGPEQEGLGFNMHGWLRFGLRATLFP